MVILNKRGYFYFIEILFILLLLTSFILFFPRAEVGHLRLTEQRNLETMGFGILKNLDESGILSKHIHPSTFTASNFTELSTFMRQSLPSTADAQIQYELTSGCFSELGAPETCGSNITGNFDVALAQYTFTKRPEPVTIKLFLWRLV